VRVAAVALAAVIALTATACGGKSAATKRHDAVTKYIESVNEIQVRLSRPLVAITKANRDFARHKSDPATIARRLREAAAKIDSLRLRIAAIDSPPDTARLKSLLVELARHEASLARELAALATFQPAFSSALSPLAAAGKGLTEALKSKANRDVKAAALDAYAAAIGGVIESLGRLRPPPVSAALYGTQRATLEQVRASASSLAQGLRDKHAMNLPSLLRHFNAAAIANQSLAAQRSQIEAIRLYNLRVSGIDRLEIRISREQTTLQRRLG